MMKWLSLIIMFIVFIALLAVTLGNTHPVDFNLVGLPTVSLPLVVYLWVAFVVGCLIGMLAMFGRLLRLRSEAVRLGKELKQAREHNADLQARLDEQPVDPTRAAAEVIVPVQP